VVLCFLLIALAYALPSRLPTLSGAVATEAGLRIGGGELGALICH
jgi:hypothetical protein